MRGLGCALFVTCAVAKATALAVAMPSCALGWLAWLADDAAFALAFALLTWRAPAALAISGYIAAIGYVALNVAVVRAVGTPLVASMLAGVDPAMSDSATRYLEPRFLLPCVLVLAVAAWAPFHLRQLTGRARNAAAAVGACLTLLGVLPHATPPAQRNAVAALLRSTWPRTWNDSEPPPRPEPHPAAPIEAPFAAPIAALAGCARGRSVVVVVLESAAARFLRPYGADCDPMPFCTETAAHSLLCAKAWAVYPESIKGQLALWHSVAPAPDTSAEQHARVPVPGLAKLLAPHGYRSGLFHAGRFAFLGMRAVIGAAGFDTMADAATISGERESSFGVDEESTVAALLRFVDALPPAQPFLAAYLPIAGHHPYSSPPGGPFRTDNQRDCYRNALHYADRAVRALWQGVCQRRPADSLLLCIVGDHGQAFGEHDGNFGHTFALYEENLHVPLLLCAPGVTDAGARYEQPMSHLDLAPTLLDLLGLLPCAQHQGSSILRGRATNNLAFTDWGEQLVATREGDWKLILDLGTDSARLFDLGRDPGERTDVAATNADLVARLRARALAWIGAERRLVNGW